MRPVLVEIYVLGQEWPPPTLFREKIRKTAVFRGFWGKSATCIPESDKINASTRPTLDGGIFEKKIFFRKIIFRGGKRGTKKREKRIFFWGPRVSEYP